MPGASKILMCRMMPSSVVAFSSHQLCESVIRIVMIHRPRRDELVLDEHRRRNGTLIQNVQADPDEILAIFLRKIGDRTNKPRLRLTEFCPSFR